MTPNGFTLDRAIQSGVDNQDSGVGIYAGDEVRAEGETKQKAEEEV